MELFILSQPMSIAHGLVRQNSRKAIDRRPLCRESLFEIYENRRRTGRRRLMAAKRRRTTLWRVLVSFSSSNRAWFGSRTLFPKNKRKAHDMFSFSPQSLNVSAPPLFHRRTQSNRPWTIIYTSPSRDKVAKKGIETKWNEAITSDDWNTMA